MKPIIHAPGQGRRFTIPGTGYTTFIKVGDQESGGLTFAESIYEPGWSASAHRHLNRDEMFYVIEGEVEYTVSGQTILQGAGGFLLVPRGSSHALANVGTGVARQLVIWIPGGFEGFFVELEAALRDGNWDEKRLTELWGKYDTEPG